jgi:hypothetical protein
MDGRRRLYFSSISKIVWLKLLNVVTEPVLQSISYWCLDRAHVSEIKTAGTFAFSCPPPLQAAAAQVHKITARVEWI